MQKRKWRVLIVDDEFRIGMLIKKLIRWEEFPLECADIVDTGLFVKTSKIPTGNPSIL